jgi:phosphoheptose isomerase
MDKMTFITALCKGYPELESIRGLIVQAAEALIVCFSQKGKLLICGNGGSSCDADHIVGEMVKSFEMERPISSSLQNKLINLDSGRGTYLAEKLEQGLPAISLSSQTALMTAVANDTDSSLIFAQQVIVYGSDHDILLGISTSGNSQNILNACLTAKALGMKIIGLTGKTGGEMRSYCDILINVPENSTGRVQELHLPVLHALCREVENHFYGIKSEKK